MEFDEQGNSGFPVTLSAPGQLNVTEKRIDSPLASSLEACTSARMHAPGLARTNVDSAVMVLSPYCTQMLAVRSAAPLPSSSTIH
jgi:hypothetical protein